MDSDNQNQKNCAEDDEDRLYCDVCDKFAIDRYYNDQLKSQTHFSNIRKRQPEINTSSKSLLVPIILAQPIMDYYCGVCDETIKFKSEKNLYNA